MFENDYRFFKTAALELNAIDDHEVVKIASIFRRMKNWWKSLGDPDYRKKVQAIGQTSPRIKALLSDLNSNLDRLQKAISDRDVEDYGATVGSVKALTTQLATALGGFQQLTTEIVDSVPVMVVDDQGRQYSEEYIQSVAKGYTKDPELLERLKSQLPPGTPQPGQVNQKLQDIEWFRQFDTRHVYVSYKAQENIIKNIKEILLNKGQYKISKKAIDKMVNPVVDKIIENFKRAFLNGWLYSYKFPEVSKAMESRPANQMQMMVNAGAVNIPDTSIWIDFPLVLAYDLLASGAPSEKISIAAIKNMRWSTYSGMSTEDFEEYEKSFEEPTEARRFDQLMKFAATTDIWWKDPPPGHPKGKGLSIEFWVKFVQMCQRLGVNPFNLAAVINSESGFDPGARNFARGPKSPPVAQGLNQLIRTVALGLGMSEELWKNFYKLSADEQLPWVEKYFSRAGIRGRDAGEIYLKNFGGFKNPDGSLYASKEVQEAFKKQNPGAVFPNPDYQQAAINQNPGLVENGRIMPQKVKSLVAKGIGGEIGKKIQIAVDKTKGIQPPAFQEPSRTYRGKTQTPVQTQQPQEVKMDNSFEQIMQIVQGGGPVQKLVKKAIIQNSLPKTSFVISITGEDRLKIARAYASILRNELDAETSIHSEDGNEIHIEASIYGSEKAVSSAITGFYLATKKTMEETLGKKLKITAYQHKGRSKLPLWNIYG